MGTELLEFVASVSREQQKSEQMKQQGDKSVKENGSTIVPRTLSCDSFSSMMSTSTSGSIGTGIKSGKTSKNANNLTNKKNMKKNPILNSNLTDMNFSLGSNMAVNPFLEGS